MGVKTKQHDGNIAPGPGKYSIESGLNANKGYSIGNSKKDDWVKNKVPGPGDYDTSKPGGAGGVSFA
jgi:hypothetical protein